MSTEKNKNEEALKKIAEVLANSKIDVTSPSTGSTGGNTDGTKFVVDLQGLTLPDETARRIESQVRQVIMTELAKTDTSGDRSMMDNFGDIVIKTGRLPGTTWGLVAKFPSKIPSI